MPLWETVYIDEYQHVTMVLKDGKPWVVLAPSAMLHKKGLEGYGLYAAKAFAVGTDIGKYAGRIVGSAPTQREAMMHPIVRRLNWRNDYLLVVERVRNQPGERYVVVDGSDAPAPFLQRVNDVHGTRRKPNVLITPAGNFRVARKMVRYNVRRSWTENGKAELLTDYGEEYWEGRTAGTAIDLS